MHDTQDTSAIPPAEPVRGEPPTGPRLGIIGGGQLSRMMAMAAQQLGCEVAVLEKSSSCPAASLASRSLVGDWNMIAPLLELAKHADVLTLENEFVDAGLLAELESAGHVVWPSSRTLALVQDKFTQKQALEAAGLPIPKMRAVAHPAELVEALDELGLPAVLKARRNGYDGRGNATIRTLADIDAAWQQLGGDRGNSLFVEEFFPFSAELAVIITRAQNGGSAAYPVVETVQKNHVCHLVRAPAVVEPEVAQLAAETARRAVEAVGAVGSFGVEMFVSESGGIVVNELAPRVHNSGHYTIEACACSQFENHVRAVLGLPLGSPAMVAPAAAMVNLLGTGFGPGRARGLDRALQVPGAHLHLYGKSHSGAGRKMGHVTALGGTPEEAEESAASCAAHITFCVPS